MIENDDAPRQIAWTTEEEIALVKGWVVVSKNKYGNARKKHGSCSEVLDYIESKTKQYGHRTYDMVVGRWKTVRPVVIRFSGVYSNVMYSPKWKETELPKFTTESDGGSKSHMSFGSSSAMLMVTEMTSQEKEKRLAFIEIKKRKVKCRERKVAAQEYRAHQEDIRFYHQPYDHLTGD
ncbi:hypothetical protein Tco_0307566 [Tanacetum coccineum]